MRCRDGALFEGHELGVHLDPVACFLRVRSLGILTFEKPIWIDRLTGGLLRVYVVQVDTFESKWCEARPERPTPLRFWWGEPGSSCTLWPCDETLDRCNQCQAPSGRAASKLACPVVMLDSVLRERPCNQVTADPDRPQRTLLRISWDIPLPVIEWTFGKSIGKGAWIRAGVSGNSCYQNPLPI